jgi:DNA-binding transcriptional MocR family regulator
MTGMARTAHRYRTLATQIAATIRAGALRGGHRLPSVRHLSRERGISVTTTLAAYRELEASGLVEARARSGYFVCRNHAEAPVPRAPRLNPRAPVARLSVSPGIEALMVSMRDSTVLPLGAATIDAALLPARSLNRLMATLARESAAAGATYGPPQGVATLRQQLANRSLTWGTAIPADGFVVTVGAMEALNLALRAVTRPGDLIALESPTYFGVLQVAEGLGLRVIEIPCASGDGLDLDHLAQVLRAQPVRACVASPNFHNPTGSCMSNESKERLVRLLARHDLPLVEDDLYGDLAFDGTRPSCAQAFDRHGRVLLCGSVSKTLAPGYRVGWVAAGRYQARVEQLKFSHTIANATLPQMAVAEFLSTGRYDRHLRSLRATFAVQVQRMREAVTACFPEGTRISQPQGAFFLWIELPPALDTMALQQAALRARIAVAPGPLFSASGRFGNFLRLSCGLPWSARVSAGIARLGELIDAQLARARPRRR